MTKRNNRRVAHTAPSIIETPPWGVPVKARLALVDDGDIYGPGELLVVKEYLNPTTGEWDRQPGGDPCELIVDAVIAASDARIMATVSKG
jgi:hypothetical protein